jgi:GT2 family glycosyltransferase
MTGELVTVVIPSYNSGRFVREAVESVLAQTYRNLETILIDDGSQDDTREQLAPYVGRIHYVYQTNQGLSAARNAGIRRARGEFIALLDADDLWHPQKIELQMQYLEEHPTVGLVAGDAMRDRREIHMAIKGASQDKVSHLSINQLVLRPLFGPSSALIRKQCFNTVGLFDTRLHLTQDYEMWVRIACHFPLVQLRLPLWWYRVHDANMSHAIARTEEDRLRATRIVFARGRPLGRHFFLRQKALSYVAYSTSCDYDTSGTELRALHRITRSLLLWPLPYRRRDVTTVLARPKRLVVLLLRLLRRLAAQSLPRRSRTKPGTMAPDPVNGS